MSSGSAHDGKKQDLMQAVSGTASSSGCAGEVQSSQSPEKTCTTISHKSDKVVVQAPRDQSTGRGDASSLSGGAMKQVTSLQKNTYCYAEAHVPPDEKATGGTKELRAGSLNQNICLDIGTPDLLTHVVIPTRLCDNESQVYLPPGESLWGFATAAATTWGSTLLRSAEAATQRLLGLERTPTAIRAGTSTTGQKLVAVVVPANPRREVARRTKSRWVARSSSAAMWCALSALTLCSPQSYWATVAVCTVRQFTAHDPTTGKYAMWEQLAREQINVKGGVGEAEGPRTDRVTGDMTTPRQLLGRAQRGLDLLRYAMESEQGPLAEVYREWADVVQPLPLEEIPKDLWDKPLRLTHGSLQTALFAPRLPVYDLPWLPRAPPQPPLTGKCAGYSPPNATSMLLPSARKKVAAWKAKAERDLQCLEEQGADCDRNDKPPTLAIAQSELEPCARGRVWNCESRSRCVIQDYTVALNTDFNLENLRRRFKGYPDQRLASNILEGVRLEADVELQVVLQPNNVKVGPGYSSVQKTVRELKELGFYDFHLDLPFVPINVVGQGSTRKKLGLNKYRRTSDFSAPHRVIRDADGRLVVPVNNASKEYMLPSWFSEDRADLLAWDDHRYAHVRWKDKAARKAPVWYKFPKEFKPQLADVMRDGALLLGASLELDEPIFVWVSDAAHYFNQLAYAPEEWWKSALVVGAREGDVSSKAEPFHPHQPIVVSEKRLGFGTFASSNIAQRFSNALVGWTLERFDELEEEAAATKMSDAWQSWVGRRTHLSTVCQHERRLRTGEAYKDCNQTRLATIHMYTDDPVFVAVGVERALRLMRAWHEIVTDVNLTMAGPEKRQLGAGAEWIGVLLLVGIGIVVVPRYKLLRASQALEAALRSDLTFDDYRALVGLLEHLRVVAQLEAHATNVLYRPHGPHGDGRRGPNAVVHPDGLMRECLVEWTKRIMRCAGALLTLALKTSAVQQLRSGETVFHASSDAAGDGKGSSGIGGYLHGYFWRVAVPHNVLALCHITTWEMLAAAVNILVAARVAGDASLLAMKSDAALVHRAIARQKSKSHHIQAILNGLRQSSTYQKVAHRLVEEHVSGDGNTFSDLVSRGLWPEFEELCAALGFKAIPLPLTAEETGFLTSTLESFTRSPAELAAVRALTSLGLRHERPLTPTEKGLGKRRRDNSDGDGPFTPPWVKERQAAGGDGRANAQRSPQDRPTSTLRNEDKLARGFAPPWVRTKRAEQGAHQQGGPKQASTERQEAYTPASALRPGGARTYSTSLGAQSTSYSDKEVEKLVRRLINDKSPGRIDAPEPVIREMVREVHSARQDGVNPRTQKKEQLAWNEFREYAQLKGFDPHLRTAWTRAFPERESLKLAGFLIYVAQRMRPRSKRDAAPKPQSVYQRYLALRRVFTGQELPPEADVKHAFRGLLRRFLRTHGIEALRPKRVEPITPGIVEKMVTLAEQGTSRIRGRPWHLNNRVCFAVTAWSVVNLQVGSRKGESVKLPGDVDANDWYTRSSVAFRIGGVILTDPAAEELQSMQKGDSAILSPRGSKCDQWGTCWGTDPIYLPFHDTQLNPARWLRDQELTWPCRGAERTCTPLFADEQGAPFSDSTFSTLLRAVLTQTIGATQAAMYTPHSWRVWLASALRMSGASDPQIQAFVRWMNPESLKIYSRMTMAEYTTWMDKVMRVHSIDTARTTNLPIMDTEELLWGWTDTSINKLFDATTTEDVSRASKRARSPPTCHATPRPPRETAKRNNGTPPSTPTLPRKPDPKPRARRNGPQQETLADAALRVKHYRELASSLSRSTSGVGCVNHRFPNKLDDYRTYSERESRRPAPTQRFRSLKHSCKPKDACIPGPAQTSPCAPAHPPARRLVGILHTSSRESC